MTSFTLSTTDTVRLREAVASLLAAAEPIQGDGALAVRLPTSSSLRAGAEAAQSGKDDDAARRFVSLLEVGYLVAVADGLAPAERDVLADLLEHATGRAVDHAAMRLHFDDLDAACLVLGEEERLMRAAADFEEVALREEALSFAALVSLADGEIGPPEVEALAQLGRHLGIGEGEVHARIAAIVAGVERALAGGRSGSAS